MSELRCQNCGRKITPSLSNPRKYCNNRCRMVNNRIKDGKTHYISIPLKHWLSMKKEVEVILGREIPPDFFSARRQATEMPKNLTLQEQIEWIEKNK